MTSEAQGPNPGDPFKDRQPTSHERMAGHPWDGSCYHGPAPWDHATHAV